jgi:hypothetical protein
VQVLAIVEVIPLGWHRMPLFWAGAIFWGIFGYYWYNIMMWLHKEHYWIGIVIVVILSVGGYFGLQQFYRWILLSFTVFGIRCLREVLANKAFVQIEPKN